ncbi:membrane protein [Clostridium acetobutylicum]|uniref:T-RNA-processing ribonuclease BN n=1 Tax=Clostridium acetobutylicum (strain ATCC 824 / DSM 792 / JCM 1419 / IAM 19013 / LMG 5710 / NBRC 13948 / NRRL B-527 / VKM B-1787 / 2291 / W) TaxID=272562 RepID=Q97MM7_CLOAB|nr:MULTISPECIES: YihY/virulence factor BrkB family protein [Clostridium]AAK78151.1 T-RNA-processing ribonuclease BN [Clostridium acetobutylicum ATCC 824]ADZ19213.1 T-RNA-processing ribonuclease BN [Clostridium acetobutylicum EA 2018]AEI31091.1 T-RNA-processing ribonuclease BN [Clostridium acetobutylicum DSM 1731]AWV82266.1 YihY/virulence factor BrkB family protein [Clostridium acetobutylicum]MBC2395975.1 YihY/virulence factor BrkB family protein [Clostridium acetobutylicum]
MKRLLLDLISRFNEDDVPALGSQLAYYLVLSFFPFIIFIMTLIGYTSLNNKEILMVLSRIMPESAFNLIHAAVAEVISTKHSQLMSLSLVLTIWSASAGFTAVIKGLNKAYGVQEARNFIKVRFVSILCTIGVAFIILTMMFLLILGRIILNYLAYKLGFSHKVIAVWEAVRYLIFVSTAIFIFTALYRYAPCKKLMWIEVLPGSLFSTLNLILASFGFAYYVNNFANYSVIYGSIGAIIILLTWLFLVAVIVILGGEINAVLSQDINIDREN